MFSMFSRLKIAASHNKKMHGHITKVLDTTCCQYQVHGIQRQEMMLKINQNAFSVRT